eukprot:831884_1
MDDPNYLTKRKDAGSEKILYCIRHAQSESNAALRSVSTYVSSEFWGNKCDPNIKDPQLSEAGQKQVIKLQTKLDNADFVSNYNIDVCFVSPFSRAIDTALGIFKYNPSVKVIVLPDLRPHFKNSQSTGRLRKSALELKYKSADNISFEFINHELWWNPKNVNRYNAPDKNIYGVCDDEMSYYDEEDDYDDEKAWEDAFDNDDETKLKFETKNEFEQRLGRLKSFLASRSEHNIVLVGHCAYFRALLNIWSFVANCAIVEAHFDGNTETITHTTFVDF